MAVLAVYHQGNTVYLGAGSPNAWSTATFSFGTVEMQALWAKELLPWLKQAGVTRENLEFIVTSGVFQEALPSGIYRLDNSLPLAEHWGCLDLCNLLAEHFSCAVYLIDPATRAECFSHALVTGTPVLERTCFADHFLFKFLARREAEKRGLHPSQGRFIVAHLDEVNQLGAVVDGKVVDCLTSADEGPFALNQSGGLPFDGVLDLCSSAKREEVLHSLREEGGLRGYLGINTLAELENEASEQRVLIEAALAYQVAKEVGALAAVLRGRPDAIICAGVLAGYEPLMTELAARIGFLAPLSVESENQTIPALMAGAQRVMDREPIINKR